jgi:hypothetical protein
MCKHLKNGAQRLHYLLHHPSPEAGPLLGCGLCRTFDLNPTDTEVVKPPASREDGWRNLCGVPMRIVVATFSQLILFSAAGVAMTYALLSVK